MAVKFFLGSAFFFIFWFFRNCAWKSFFQSFLNLWWQCGGISDGNFSKCEKNTHPSKYSIRHARRIEWRHLDIRTKRRRRGEGWNITVQPCLVTGLAPAWWNGADQPLHYVRVHFHARHWTPSPCVVEIETLPFCVLVEPSKSKKHVYKPFSTWISSLQPKGDVVKTLFLSLFIPIAFGDPCFDTNECPATYA